MNCHWNLSSNVNTILELVFSIFKTEAFADYLSLYDGNSTSSNLIGRFSGEIVPGPYILSSSNNLHIKFTSNNVGQDFGFRARYRGDIPLGIFLLMIMNTLELLAYFI